MTANHPFSRVIVFDYTNNRCGCTFVDHPGWKMPVDPVELPSEEELEVWGDGPPWLTTQRR